MVGLEKFRSYFADHTDNYVVIGGIACGIYADMNAQPPRVTHDIDTILVVEALSRPFVEKFMALVQYDMPNADMLKAIGAKGINAITLLHRLSEIFSKE